MGSGFYCGILFWKVIICVEGFINGVLRNFGVEGYYVEIIDWLDEYEVFMYD